MLACVPVCAAAAVEGRLPDSFATLPLLEVLDLRGNALKGSLPRSFSQLSNLCQLDLSRNQFSGEVTPSPKTHGQ